MSVIGIEFFKNPGLGFSAGDSFISLSMENKQMEDAIYWQAIATLVIASMLPLSACSTASKDIFMQDYWTNTYQDQVRKTLLLQKEGGVWKITRES